jgi:hypothetical protein
MCLLTPLRASVFVALLAGVLAAGAWAAEGPRKAIGAADQSRARKILLQQADLPQGWKVHPSPKDAGPQSGPECAQTKLSDLTETADVSRDFEPGAVAFSDVESSVGMLRTRAQALTLWKRVPTERSFACAARSGAGLPKGSHVTFRRLAAPGIGERSVAWQFRMTIPGLPGTLYASLVYAMKRRTFAVLVFGDLGSPFDPALARKLVLKSGARLDRYAR